MWPGVPRDLEQRMSVLRASSSSPDPTARIRLDNAFKKKKCQFSCTSPTGIFKIRISRLLLGVAVSLTVLHSSNFVFSIRSVDDIVT
jgi:hypothetical protein